MSRSIEARSPKIVKGPPSTDCDVVVLGAGPYGLSAGVYLKAKQSRIPALRWIGISTSIPGLHFIGAAAARSFGPLLCFVAGTEFACKELAAHIFRHKAERVSNIRS